MRVAKILYEQTAERAGCHTDVVFLQGCNLRCQHCFNPELVPCTGGTEMSPEEIWDNVSPTFSNTFAVSGGEPLIQESELTKLMYIVHNRRYSILFTNGVLLWKYPYLVKMFNEIRVDIKPDVSYMSFPEGPVYCFSVVPFYPASNIALTCMLNDIKKVVVREIPGVTSAFLESAVEYPEVEFIREGS